jgi:hypothetical protein
LQQESKRKIIN